MLTRYQIIPVEGDIEHKEVDWSAARGYNCFKTLLEPIFNPHYWEHVTVVNDLGERGDMFVNEMGRLIGLPYNERASRIYSRASGRGGTIVGPAVYFPDRRVWF